MSDTAMARYFAIIRNAGFGLESQHFVKFGLTESQAAVIYAASSIRYQPNDVVLVCDAGGGTTVRRTSSFRRLH